MTIEPCRLSSWQLLEKSNWHAVLSPMLVLFKFCSHFLSFDRKLPFLDVANNKTRNSSRNKTKHQWYSRMIFGAPGKYHTRLIPLFPKTNSHKLGRRSEETSRYKKKKKPIQQGREATFSSLSPTPPRRRRRRRRPHSQSSLSCAS